MANMTLAIPDNIRNEMGQFPEINWSVIARTAISQRLLVLKKIKQFTKNSEFTEKDAIELGRKVSKELSKKVRAKK